MKMPKCIISSHELATDKSIYQCDWCVTNTVACVCDINMAQRPVWLSVLRSKAERFMYDSSTQLKR